jgi:hypothetical protein
MALNDITADSSLIAWAASRAEARVRHLDRLHQPDRGSMPGPGSRRDLLAAHGLARQLPVILRRLLREAVALLAFSA